MNKTESALRLVHPPSGVVVVAQDSSSQHRNREIAFERLAERLEPWRPRLAVHAGEVQLGAGGGLFGAVVNQALRIVRLARPGDVLVAAPAVADAGLAVGGLVCGGVLADVVLSASFALGFHPSPWFGVAIFGVGAMLPGAAVLGLEARTRAARSGSSSVPFVESVRRSPFPVAYSANSKKFGWIVGSPPESSKAGTLKAARSSITALH